MFLAAVAASGALYRTATFYVDSRDSVDDGTGKVLSVADRINSWSFTADTAANRPTRDTALIAGVPLIRFPADTQNLSTTVANAGFGGDDNPISFVVRLRFTTSPVSRVFLATHETVVAPATPDGCNRMIATSSTLRLDRDQTAGGTGAVATVTTTWVSNIWYTLGISFTGSQIRFFKDGSFLSQVVASSLTSLGTHTMITLGNRPEGSFSTRAYFAAWKGWAGVAISDAQHAYEHSQLAAWAA